MLCKEIGKPFCFLSFPFHFCSVAQTSPIYLMWASWIIFLFACLVNLRHMKCRFDLEDSYLWLASVTFLSEQKLGFFFFFSFFSSQRILRMTEKQHERWMSESLGVPLLNDDKCLLSFFAKPSILSVLLVKNPPVFFFVFLVLCRQESKKLYILSVNNKGWRKTQGTKICLGRTETCISISGFHFLTV